MGVQYCLEKNGYRYPLFQLSYPHEHEEPALFDFGVQSRHFPRWESEFQKAIALVSRETFFPGNPLEKLRLLLANGAMLISTAREQQPLVKSYFPVRFFIRSGRQTIYLGHFYRTSISNADDLFPSFIAWIDSQSERPGRGSAILVDAFSKELIVYAQERGRVAIIACLGADGVPLFGEPITLQFLLHLSRHQC